MTLVTFLALMVRYASPSATVTLDPGLLESLLAILAGSVVGPILTSLLKRLSFIDAGLGAAVNVVATLALYLAAWWAVTGADPAALGLYLLWALAAAGLGGGANNLYRKRVMPRE